MKNTNIENPEQNTIRVYFLIGKGVVLEDPSKQLNMSRLIGRDDTFRGNHINHITAGVGSDFTLWKKNGAPRNYSQWPCTVHSVRTLLISTIMRCLFESAADFLNPEHL